MSNLFQYYEDIKELARQKRDHFLPNATKFGLREIIRIYKTEGIKIRYQDGGLKKLKAAYFNDENGIDVLLNKTLPATVRLFALAHELKHHFSDTDRLAEVVACYDETPHVEKSAEVFAAEFIWPEQMFMSAIREFGITQQNCIPAKVVRFKRAMDMPVSYQFIKKRLEWFRIIERGEYDNIKFQNLETQIFGVPFYLKNR